MAGPNPPKPLNYALGTRRANRYLSRERISSALRTLAWVAPLTLLIWVYAERQQERRSSVHFPVRIAIASPDRVVLGGRERFVTAELRGPGGQLEAAKAKLLQGGDEAVVTLPVETNLAPGRHEVPTALISSDPLFRTHAISVDSTEPQTLQIEVDQVVEREVPVHVPPGVVNLDGQPVFDPPRVKIRGPYSTIRRAEREGTLEAVADLSGLQSIKTPGIHEEKSVPVSTPLRGEHITLSPASVNVTFKVRPGALTVVWAPMPVWVNSPPEFLARYRVEMLNRMVRDVRLVGPAETMAQLQLENYQPKPKARVDVSEADLPAGVIRSKQVDFDDLPPGVTVAPEDSRRTVEFRIVPLSQ